MGRLVLARFSASLAQPTTARMSAVSSYAATSLSLIGLCALAGAGVGVGSGIAMMSAQMMAEEQGLAKAPAPKATAHSVAEKKIAVFRGFAASSRGRRPVLAGPPAAAAASAGAF